MKKTELRNIILEKRKNMSEEDIEKYSKLISKSFLESDFYKENDVIYAYVNYSQEVITDYILKQAWLDGKKVAAPKVFGDNMAFCYINSFSDLAPGYKEILEPICNEIAYEEKGCMLLPGLAFDKACNRIGYGKGFYDKFLSRNNCKDFLKVALCFDFQLVDNIDVEEHDEKVDAIITEKRIVKK